MPAHRDALEHARGPRRACAACVRKNVRAGYLARPVGAAGSESAAAAAEVGIAVDERALPVRAEVNGACEILGIDPLYVANEGKLVAVVAPEQAEAALAALRSHPLGRDEPPGLVLLETAFGGSRVVDMLAGDPLPRICWGRGAMPAEAPGPMPADAVPQFWPWCGSPLGYEAHVHEPRYAALAEQARAQGKDPPPLPPRVERVLEGKSYVGACPGCRIVSHVIGHRAVA